MKDLTKNKNMEKENLTSDQLMKLFRNYMRIRYGKGYEFYGDKIYELGDERLFSNYYRRNNEDKAFEIFKKRLENGENYEDICKEARIFSYRYIILSLLFIAITILVAYIYNNK